MTIFKIHNLWIDSSCLRDQSVEKFWEPLRTLYRGQSQVNSGISMPLHAPHTREIKRRYYDNRDTWNITHFTLVFCFSAGENSFFSRKLRLIKRGQLISARARRVRSLYHLRHQLPKGVRYNI